MFIAVDIGNTNTTIGLFTELEVCAVAKFETARLVSKAKARSALGKKMKEAFKARQIDSVILCSVVPAMTKKVSFSLGSLFSAKTIVVGQDVVVPVINRYRIPNQVGQDRLVNAYAGLKLFGPGLIIVDFGTAITFDIISKKSEYLGGMIAPGLKIVQEALHKKTALLPYVELARPIEIIGRDTVSSIRAGIIYGTAGLCDGIIDRLIHRECRGYKVLATGGDAALVKLYSSRLAHIEEHLTLKGLAFIHRSLLT